MNKYKAVLHLSLIIVSCFLIYWYCMSIGNALLALYHAPVNMLIDFIRSQGFWQPPLELKILDIFSFIAWGIITLCIAPFVSLVFNIVGGDNNESEVLDTGEELDECGGPIKKDEGESHND